MEAWVILRVARCRWTGTVFDADGKPVKGAVVIQGDDPYMQQGRQEVRTDAEGRYRFPPLSPGVINVTVVAVGWAPALENHPLSTKSTNLDFHLTRGRTLRLKFVNGAGHPVPDVYVGIAGWRKIKSSITTAIPTSSTPASRIDPTPRGSSNGPGPRPTR